MTSRKRIVLLGAAGQLAYDLKSALIGHDVVPLTRAELDLVSTPDLTAVLGAHSPQLVINTAAYNLVDQAESEPEVAFANNCHGPHRLAQACEELAIPLAHFSTDYVFGLDPKRDEPWSETDAPGPVSVYGNSKLAGEYAVRAACSRHFVLRTCGLYGVKGSRGKGGNFVETMLRLGNSGKPVRVVGDQHCTPSSTADVAALTAELIETQAYGLYHLTNAGACSWYDLAKAAYELAGLRVDLTAITSAEFGAKASRPPYSVLSTAKVESLLGRAVPSWRDALGRYLEARSQPS